MTPEERAEILRCAGTPAETQAESVLSDAVVRLFAEVDRLSKQLDAARARELRDAADGIDALYPDDSPKNAAIWLRKLANDIDARRSLWWDQEKPPSPPRNQEVSDEPQPNQP